MKKYLDLRYILECIIIGIIIQTVFIIVNDTNNIFKYLEAIRSAIIIGIMIQISFKLFKLKLYNTKIILTNIIIIINIVVFFLIWNLIFYEDKLYTIGMKMYYVFIIAVPIIIFQYFRFKRANKKLKSKINNLNKK